MKNNGYDENDDDWDDIEEPADCRFITALCLVCGVLGFIVPNLVLLGGTYGYILYQHNVNGKDYQFDLLKSRMTVDEFMLESTPAQIVSFMKGHGLRPRLNDKTKTCELVTD